jgi:hypothetical protein
MPDDIDFSRVPQSLLQKLARQKRAIAEAQARGDQAAAQAIVDETAITVNLVYQLAGSDVRVVKK